MKHQLGVTDRAGLHHLYVRDVRDVRDPNLNDLMREQRLVFTYRDPCSYVEVPTLERNHSV